MILITVAGCLAMVYITGTTSPAFAEFLRVIGATEVHFGLLGGIPMVMLSMQFVGALITNCVRTRKALFMVLVIAGRLLYIPVAFLPIIFPSLGADALVSAIILIIAFSAAITNVTGPLWLSWMADLIPRRILNSYWGKRQRWMYLTWTASFLAITAFVYFVGLPITISFPILAAVAVIAGVTDIVLFLWVREPPNILMRGKPVLELLTAPLKDKGYRSFVVFSCAWSGCAMFAAAFMQLYVLKILALTVWQTTLMWCASGIGIALVSSQWGKLADEFGHRPVLAICMGLKSIVVMVFFLVTRRSALWLLPITLFVDSFWNAGILVASNGYMLKIAPQRNRSMFIAAITGLAGICGGLGAMTGGAFLDAFSEFSLAAFGRSWTNYHLLFLLNILMRWGCIALALGVKEPESTNPGQLLHQLRGTWPIRFLLFPVGFYRRFRTQWSSMDAGARHE